MRFSAFFRWACHTPLPDIYSERRRLHSKNNPSYTQLVSDKFLFMLPAEQALLKDCMRRTSFWPFKRLVTRSFLNIARCTSEYTVCISCIEKDGGT